MKTERKNRWRTGLVLFLFFFLPLRGAQAGPEDILLKFKPYLSVQEEYTNNVDLVSENKKGDFITTVFAGLRFSTQPRSEVTGEFRPVSSAAEEKYGADLDYRLGYSFYAKETNRNYVNVDGRLRAWWFLGNRIALRMNHQLTRSDESREQESLEASLPELISGSFVDLRGLYLLGTQRGRFIYLRNVFTPSLEYRFSWGGLVSLAYRSNIYNGQGPLVEDSREDFINPKFIYWFNARNGLLLEYGYSIGNFESFLDFTGHMAKGDYIYRFNPKIAIFGEYLFLTRAFEDPEMDYYVNATSLGIEYLFSRTLSGKAQLGYFWQNPEKGSKFEGPLYDLTLTQRGEKITYTLRCQGGFREDFFTAENLGFTKYYRTVGTVTYRLMEKMNASLSGSYEGAKVKYTPIGASTTSNRKDNIWSMEGNLSYELLKWLTLSLNLSYRGDHVNISNLSYSEIRGLFKIEVRYL